MITLTILTGPEAGKTFTLDNDRIEIGRGAECDLVLNDRSISRRHCVIERQGDNFVATDLQSTNSTFLNDDRTVSVHKQLIQAKDELTLGQIRLRIERLELAEAKTDTAPFPATNTTLFPAADTTPFSPHSSDTLRIKNQTRPAAESAVSVQPEDDHTRISLSSAPAPFLTPDTTKGIPHAVFPLVLTVLSGPEMGRIYIPTDDSCSLGRESTCDIVLSDSQVSSLHATIRREGERYCLSDHKSANGTFLHTKSQPVAQSDLTDGDVFILGQTQIRVGLSTTIDTQIDSVDSNEATFFSGRPGVVGSSPTALAGGSGQAAAPDQDVTQLALQPGLTSEAEDRTLLNPVAITPPISLRVIEGPNSGETFIPQPGTARFTVGRGRTANFQLHERGISRIHFSIEATPSGFMLIDTDSLNGTFLNQALERVEQVVLHDGDEIQVSKTRIQVRISETQEKTAFISPTRLPSASSLPPTGAKDRS